MSTSLNSGTTRAIVTQDVVHGELVKEGELKKAALLFAAGKTNIRTRKTYEGVYRSFVEHLRDETAGIDALNAQAVIDYRDALERANLKPSTIAVHLSALRKLEAELMTDSRIMQVKGPRFSQPPPKALKKNEYTKLLAVPDKKTLHGKRDIAILRLMGDGGLRRSEVAGLGFQDIEEIARVKDPELRTAGAHKKADATRHVVHIRAGKRGKTRSVPLTGPTIVALRAWRDARPPADTESLLLSLPKDKSAQPRALTARAVDKLVERHAARAHLPDDRRTPHVLRHTFCTNLAERGVALEVIAELAGHSDLRTTLQYVTVREGRKHRAIESLEGDSR